MELLVVVAIIGLLAGMLLPSLAKAKVKANRMKCGNNLKQVHMAFTLFANDYDGRLPWLLTHRQGERLWQGLYGTGHTGAHHLWDVQFLFLPAPIREELGAARLLASPVDPETHPWIDNEIQHGKWDGFGHAFDGVHVHMDYRSLSYALHLGSDMQRPSSLLAVTSNITGEACYEFDYPAGPAVPSYKDYFGMALHAASAGQASQAFVGNDEPDPVRLQNYAMAGLGAQSGAIRARGWRCKAGQQRGLGLGSARTRYGDRRDVQGHQRKFDPSHARLFRPTSFGLNNYFTSAVRLSQASTSLGHLETGSAEGRRP